MHMRLPLYSLCSLMISFSKYMSLIVWNGIGVSYMSMQLLVQYRRCPFANLLHYFLAKSTTCLYIASYKVLRALKAGRMASCLLL